MKRRRDDAPTGGYEGLFEDDTPVPDGKKRWRVEPLGGLGRIQNVQVWLDEKPIGILYVKRDEDVQYLIQKLEG